MHFGQGNKNPTHKWTAVTGTGVYKVLTVPQRNGGRFLAELIPAVPSGGQTETSILSMMPQTLYMQDDPQTPGVRGAQPQALRDL